MGFSRRCGILINWTIEIVDTATPKFVKSTLKRLVPGIENRIYKIAKKTAGDEIHECVIRRGPLAGRKFRCSLKLERNYWLGTWEKDLVEFFEAHLREGDVAYDIGAHKGYFSLIAASLVGETGFVVAFEPNPANRTMAQENSDLNSDLGSRLRFEEFALSDASHTVRFTGGVNSTVGHLVDDDATNAYDVQAISLDDYVAGADHPPSFIKMDIEGEEKRALPGIVETLKAHSPTLVIEVHDQESADSLFSVSEQANYRIESLIGEAIESSEAFAGRTHWVGVPR